MSGRIPPDAFAFYLGLGADRSYEAVARKFGVSKRAVTKLASKQRWQEQVEDIESKARRSAAEKTLESLEEMNGRHLRTLKIVQAKALETLRSAPLGTAMEAVRALDLAIKHERVIRGEPGDRTAGSVEETIRREYERWMTASDDGDGSRAHEDEAAEELEEEEA